MYMRNIYVNKLRAQFSNFFRYVYGRDNFDITIEYLPAIRPELCDDSGKCLPFSDIRRRLHDSIRSTYIQDIEKGVFPYGPAKDELLILRSGTLAKECTSQGQQKIIAIALKTAEGLIYTEEQNDLPLFILDDIMSELDRTTQIRLTEMFCNYQTLITTADSGYVGAAAKLLTDSGLPRLIEVSEGRFTQRKDFS